MSETSPAAGVRTFVIADVRGYTAFTQAHGDEAGARLAARFADVTRACVTDGGGDLIELRGDEALAVFESPRAAVRCAVELERRFADELRADPTLPLRVGIGIDAGEAVHVEGGYRGGALNLAARLCSVAKAGDVLISEGVVLLARRIEGVEYLDQGRVQLKGLDGPVRYFRAEFGLELPAAEQAGRPRRRWPFIVAAAGVLAAVVAAVLIVVDSRSGSGSVALAANSVGVLETDGRIAGQAPVSGPPGGIAAGLGQIWATDPDGGSLRVIDPKTATATGPPVSTGGGSEPTGIIVEGGRVWIVDSANRDVVEFDPGTGQRVRSVPVGNGAGPIAAGGGSVWVVNSVDGTLQQIPAESGKAGAPIPVGAAPSAIAVSRGAVWVTDEADGVLARVDTQTLQVTRVPAGQSPAGVAVGNGAVWVANTTDNTVTRFGLPTLAVSKIPVPAPSAIAAGAGGVWVSSAERRTVVRIDPASRRVTEIIPTRNPPGALTVAGGRVWVAVLSAPSSHRGGTLRLGLGSGFDSLDPAVAFFPPAWQLLANTNDGLVGYRRVGGGAGSVLVPDLATAIPEPQDGGLTYTFQLRRGLLYSNGEPVNASDFRYALERSLATKGGPAGYFLGAIKGASACRPGSCDLSSGVAADDAGGTITIHLSRPDPDLLEELTLPFADLLPPGSPPSNGTKSVAATGPYRVQSYVPGKRLVLVRNPHFRQWSAQAQPAGFPDRIVWALGMPLAKQIHAVTHGTLSVALGNPNGPPNGAGTVELQHAYPGQVHVFTNVQLTSFVLNTRVAPFRSELARRAVAFALDRAESLRAAGGPTTAQISCQLVPPNIPGYQPYCPFTRGRDSGVWKAPDLRRARRLAAASGTTDSPVSVSSPPGLAAETRPLVTALRSIGYRASLDVTPTAAFYRAVTAPRTHVQAWPWAYVDDYPAPSDFLRIQLGCGVPLNVTGFCDHAIDRTMDRAGRLQGTDPARANLLWDRVDRELTDAAPLVAVLNQRRSDFLAKGIGNYQHHPQWNMLVDQLWVR